MAHGTLADARRPRRVVLPVTIALVASVLGSPSGVAAMAPNDGLDPTFGGDGKVTTAFPADFASARGVAIQVNGRIVVVGTADAALDDGIRQEFAVARYTTQGGLDPSFHGTGMVMTDIGSPMDEAADVAIQSDGSIVVVGMTETSLGTVSTGIVRYESDGDLDPTFAGDGIVVLPGMLAHGLAIQPDGKIVVAGARPFSEFGPLAIARLTTTGALDPTFGTSGTATLDVEGLTGTATSVALQADGKIVVGGRSVPGDFLLARLTATGTVDTTFGGDGYVTTDVDGYDTVEGVAIQGDGKAVAAGTSGAGFLAVARYEADGDPDPGFDGDGQVEPAFFSGSDVARDVDIAADGTIVVSGWADHHGDTSFLVARYAADGSLLGRGLADFGEPGDECGERPDCSGDFGHAAAIQADGKVVIAGGSSAGWSVARFATIPPIDSLAASHATLEFGPVLVEAASTLTVTIRNPTAAAVEIGLVEITGAGKAEYGLVDGDCAGSMLAAGASCTIDVVFQPASNGRKTAQLRVHSDAGTPLLTVDLTGTGAWPPSGITWGTSRTAGPAWTWNDGNGLARTVASGDQRLHVVYATDRIGSIPATNSGPYLGVYYLRSPSGATWTAPRRLNATTQHAARTAIAASGARVYVTWVTQTRATSVDPTAPRMLYVRVNTNHGGSTSWRTPVRLTSTTGRVDAPAITATGNGDVFIAFTNSVTGQIRLLYSRDGGVTWGSRTLGSTTLSTADGWTGRASIAASGTTVVVAWRSDPGGTVLARRSDDRGATWSPAFTVTNVADGSISAAARASRIAVSWSTGPEIRLRLNDAGAWGVDRRVAGIDPLAQRAYSPAVVLQDGARVAIAWSEECQGDLEWSRLLWSESADDGVHWFDTPRIAGPLVAARRTNDRPSVLWPSVATRQVLWNGYTTFPNVAYRLYFVSGTGTPAAPAGASGEASVDLAGTAVAPSAFASCP